MRRGKLLASMLVIAIAVPAFGLATVPMTTEVVVGSVQAPTPIVVIAHIDSGANAYHEEFRDDSSLAQQHPCTYIAGYPCGAEALNINLTGPNWDAAFAGDIPIWQGVQTSSIASQHLYWIPGTKVVGAIRFGSGGTNAPVVPIPPAGVLNFIRPEWPILDEHGHGTMTATRSAGNTGSLCDTNDCRFVIIEGLGGTGTRWAAEQGWIDVQTNSWLNLVPPPANQDLAEPGPYGTTNAFKYAQDKMLVYAASGNGAGYINGFAPTPTEILSTAAPGVVLVGAHDNGFVTQWSGAPAHVVGDGYGGNRAKNNSYSEFGPDPIACCTSAASPFAAGGGARVVLESRRLLGDLGTGLRDVGGVKAIAVNLSMTGVFSGPLSNGILSLDEAKELVMRTAEVRPAAGVNDGILHWTATGNPSGSEGYIQTWGPGANPFCQGCMTSPVKWSDVDSAVPAYPSIGYGAVNERSIALAASVLAGTATLPDRSDVDEFFAIEAMVRGPIFEQHDLPDIPDLSDVPIPKDPILGSGTIHGPNPAAGLGVRPTSSTEALWVLTASLAAQGVDALVLPVPSGSDGKTLKATGTSAFDETLGHDLDLYFYDADRDFLGAAATGAADESGVVPPATAFVVVGLFLGAEVDVVVTIT